MKTTKLNSTQKGLALPTALLLLLVISIAGSLFTKTAIRNLQISRQDQATVDTFQVAEGAIHSMIGQMSARSHLWREKIPLPVSPASYQEFSQLDYGASNGIPTCNGAHCLRNLYPMGGGLIKNFGPVGGDGDIVHEGLPVWNQLAAATLPTGDITLNNQIGFAQIEKLDETISSGSNLGAELTNNPTGGTTAKSIRFRITGKTFRQLGNRTGESTVVVIAEMPAT